MTDDDNGLGEFLLVRITEDERQAKKHLPDADRQGWGSYPLRVLADCEAKRLIVEGWVGAHRLAGCTPTLLTLIHEWMQALALPYSDHPDYLEVWRP